MTATKITFSSRPTQSPAFPSFIHGREAEELEQAIYDKIRERAYLLFEQSGRQPGNESANWMRAESEILRSDAQVRESGSWLTLNASIPEACAEGLQIVVRSMRVLVRARKSTNGPDGSEPAQQGGEEIFLAVNLTAEVDPGSATASFRDHNLHLMVRKRRPDKPRGV
jgi:HSP20 family molecular chaperone IbpA